jgi:hypothetical protein
MADYRYLEYLFKKQGMTVAEYTEHMGWSSGTYKSKMQSKTEFKLSEMRKTKELLNMSEADFKRVFGV